MGGQAARPTFQLILPVAAPAASEPASAPSPTRNESFTTTWNWVTWLFSTTPSNSLTHTDWMLRIVRDARSTVCRTASSKLSEDRPDSSMNFTTAIISSRDRYARLWSAQNRSKAIRCHCARCLGPEPKPLRNRVPIGLVPCGRRRPLEWQRSGLSHQTFALATSLKKRRAQVGENIKPQNCRKAHKEKVLLFVASCGILSYVLFIACRLIRPQAAERDAYSRPNTAGEPCLSFHI